MLYFGVVLWGARFREYFLTYCLPSLGNQGRLLVATTKDDWVALNRDTRFRDAELIEIPPCPPNISGRVHMGIGHKLICERAFRDRAKLMILTPDSILSNGAIDNVLKHDVPLVLAAALRFGEEPLLRNLESRNSRDMVRAALSELHPETVRYEWDSPFFPPFYNDVPSAAYWQAPSGILVHSLSWAPMVMDYSALKTHNTSPLDRWTLDGDYVYANFNALPFDVIEDSDEVFYASWAPMEEYCHFFHDRPLLGSIGKRARFAKAFHGPTFDHIKRKAFEYPVRWHAEDLTDEWSAVEERARHEITKIRRRPRIEKIECASWIAHRIGTQSLAAIRGDKEASAWLSRARTSLVSKALRR